MPDLELLEAAWVRPPGRITKRKHSDTNVDIATDTDSQIDRFKRRNTDDDNDSIDLTPSHRIPEVLGSAATESTPSISTGGTSRLPNPLLGAPSFQSPRPGVEALCSDNKQVDPIGKWDPKEWEAIEFDSDEENMSLAITMKLAYDLSLLKSFLEIYRKFNIHLGGKPNSRTLCTPDHPPIYCIRDGTDLSKLPPDMVSGPRHRGFLSLIFSTVTRLESHTTRLRALRTEKQRGNPTPSTMEIIAEKIARRCHMRRKYLWDTMEEKVDMTNDVARATWVRKKKAVLGDVMGGLVGYLEELGEEEGWKEREVGEEVEAVRSDGQGGFEEGRMDPGRRKARWVSDVEIDCPRVARGGFCKVLRRDWRLEKWDEHYCEATTRRIPAITYRHILAPAPTSRAMERTGYPNNNRRPAFGPRRSSSHAPRRDPSDFNDGHRALAVRPRYPDRAKSSAGYDAAGIRGGVIYCPPPRPAGLRQGGGHPMPGSSYLGDPFAGLDELARRGAEVYEVPISYTSSDLEGPPRSRSSAQNSRPSSRGSEYVYAEYDDDEERERKRFLGTELYGYLMAMRLKERLVDVRQVLNLYKDFDRASGCIFVIETQRDFVEMIRQAIDATKEVEKPLRRWAEAGKGKTERAYCTHKLLETASEVIRLWQKRFEWIRTRSDELLYAHGAKGSDKRQTYATRREKCTSSVDESSMLLKPREMDEIMEGVQELGDRLKGDWRRDGQLTPDEMLRRKGLKWGTIAGRSL
ncbi:MAG: hypothetical protein ASARMPRED_002800 [Alectoria sarmentosa]|nr:MAG: hypothetical protein ASARMPRED_002800 [Alectoria sarmentosa]